MILPLWPCIDVCIDVLNLFVVTVLSSVLLAMSEPNSCYAVTDNEATGGLISSEPITEQGEQQQ